MSPCTHFRWFSFRLVSFLGKYREQQAQGPTIHASPCSSYRSGRLPGNSICIGFTMDSFLWMPIVARSTGSQAEFLGVCLVWLRTRSGQISRDAHDPLRAQSGIVVYTCINTFCGWLRNPFRTTQETRVSDDSPVHTHKQWFQPWLQSGAGVCPSTVWVVLRSPAKKFSFLWEK